MSIKEIKNIISNDIKLNGIESSELNISNKATYLELHMPSNDVFDFETRINSNGKSFVYLFEFYKIENDAPKNPRKISGWSMTNNHSFSLERGYYIVKITANNPITLTLDLGQRNYIQLKEFYVNIHNAHNMTASIDVKKHRPRVKCNEPLEYELVDGQLPPGLVLYRYDGLIAGVITNMDCEDGDSPSFNWFFRNHDGVNQSWARMYRFKLKVMLQRDKNISAEEWFCIRVHNNWTYDRIKYEEHIKDNMSSVTIVGDTVSLTPLGVAKLQETNIQHECIPCNDPNANYYDEFIALPKEYDFRFAFEVVEWYKKNQLSTSHFSLTLAQKKLFLESLGHTYNPNDRIKYEYQIKDDIFRTRKYVLDGRSFNDFDSTLLASRNIQNVIRDADANTYYGNVMTVDLWYF